MKHIQGVIPATITCFAPNGELDLPATNRHLDFVIDSGVHGIFALGTNGEAPLLTFREKQQVIEAVVTHVSGRVPVILGVGCPSTQETLELACFTAKSGAAALAIVTPYYFPLSQEGALQHYRTIADAVDLPVYIYHIPSRTGNTLTLDTVQQLANYRNIRGIKDSSGNLSWIYRVRKTLTDFSILLGNDALFYSGLLLGINGSVSAIANVFPELGVKLYEEFSDGHIARAKQYQDDILEIRSVFQTFPYQSSIKAALELRGFSVGPLRAPLQTVSAQDRTELKQKLAALSLL